ncbi:unnamed protein product, partial [Closterium sp. NIES-65]
LYNFGSVLFGMQPFAIAADGQHTRMGALQGSPEVALVLPTRPQSHPPSPFQNCPNSRSAPTAACPRTPPAPVLSSCPPSPRHTPPELYNFGSVLFGMQPFAIAADRQHTRMGALQGSPEVALVHDCAMSSRFLVFTIPPYAASAGDVAQMPAGQQSLGNRLTYDESPCIPTIHHPTILVFFYLSMCPPSSLSQSRADASREGKQSLGNRFTYDEAPCISTQQHPTIFAFFRFPCALFVPCPLQMLAGKQSLGNRFTYDESKPTRVVVVGKESLSVEVQMDVWPPFSNYHFCNAYEDGDKLHVLLTVLDGPRDGLEGVFKDMYGESWQRNNQCSVWELVIDTNTWDLLSRRRAMHSEPGTRGPVLGMEFAVVNPAFTSRKSRYLYVLGSMPERDREELWSNGGLGDGVWYGGAGVKGEEDGEGEEEAEGEEGEEGREEEGGEEEGKKMAEYGYLNCIQKYDLKTKQVTTHVTPPGCYVNECSFIPNSGTDNEDASKEDEGYLAAFVYDAARHRSHVVVLDARDVAAAPVAVVHLQSHVPFHFHGTWAGKATML